MSCASMDDERCPAVIFGSVSASEARLITQHWKQVLSHSTAHITTDKDNLVCLYSIHSRNAHRFCPPAAGRTVCATACSPTSIAPSTRPMSMVALLHAPCSSLTHLTLVPGGCCVWLDVDEETLLGG